MSTNTEAEILSGKGLKPHEENAPSSGTLLLPAADERTSTEGLQHNEQLNIGETIKMEQLGPMIINSDGTMSRISNWASMTDAERDRTVRILRKRNLIRKEKILAQDDQQEAKNKER